MGKKITVEIEDSLQDRIDQCIVELKQAIVEWVEENPDADDICLNNDVNYSGRLNEIVDSNCPVYYSEINDTHYLHGDVLDQAYNNAGIYGEGERPDNYKQVAIYIHLEQSVNEWFNDLDIDLNEFRESGESFADFMDWNED